MKIVFEKSPFLQPVTDLLREMDKAGFFSHGLLIGSWPMLVYSEYFTLSYGLATNDIDFAVDNATDYGEYRRFHNPHTFTGSSYAAQAHYCPAPYRTG